MVIGFFERSAEEREARRQSAKMIGTFHQRDGKAGFPRKFIGGGQTGETAADDEDVFWRGHQSVGLAEGNQAIEVVLQQHADENRWKQRGYFIHSELVHQQVKHDGGDCPADEGD